MLRYGSKTSTQRPTIYKMSPWPPPKGSKSSSLSHFKSPPYVEKMPPIVSIWKRISRLQHPFTSFSVIYAFIWELKLFMYSFLAFQLNHQLLINSVFCPVKLSALSIPVLSVTLWWLYNQLKTTVVCLLITSDFLTKAVLIHCLCGIT